MHGYTKHYIAHRLIHQGIRALRSWWKSRPVPEPALLNDVVYVQYGTKMPPLSDILDDDWMDKPGCNGTSMDEVFKRMR